MSRRAATLASARAARWRCAGLVLVFVWLAGLPAAGATLRILAVGDGHGRVSSRGAAPPATTSGGADAMLTFWRRVEGYEPRRFLVLDCGDAIGGAPRAGESAGAAVVEALNRLGVDALTPGNHEFEAGVEALAAWRRAAKFPFLAANLFRAGGPASDLAAPFVIYDEQGIKVGLIGLTNANPGPAARAAGLRAERYAPALRSAAAKARAAGAEVLVVVVHAPLDDVRRLARESADLRIPVMFGAHDHRLAQEFFRDAGTWLVQNGQHFESYSRVDLEYDATTRRTGAVAVRQVRLADFEPERPSPSPSPGDLGWTTKGLPVSWALYNFVVDAWLERTAGVDAALTNPHSLREPLAAGGIAEDALRGVMPFENKLLVVELSGGQVLDLLPKRDKLMGLAGVRVEGGRLVAAQGGAPIAPDRRLRVLVNSYMYEANAALRRADPQPEVVHDDWRRPVVEWLRAHPTTPARPLEGLVDTRPRRTR